eukprot:scaffold3198_cov213-Alexandrium_tamarense.AAC.15
MRCAETRLSDWRQSLCRLEKDRLPLVEQDTSSGLMSLSSEDAGTSGVSGSCLCLQERQLLETAVRCCSVECGLSMNGNAGSGSKRKTN